MYRDPTKAHTASSQGKLTLAAWDGVAFGPVLSDMATPCDSALASETADLAGCTDGPPTAQLSFWGRTEVMQPCAGKCIRGWGQSACSAGRGRQFGRYQKEWSEWLPAGVGHRRQAGWQGVSTEGIGMLQNRRCWNAAVRTAVVG